MLTSDEERRARKVAATVPAGLSHVFFAEREPVNQLACSAAIAALELCERDHTVEQLGPKIELLARTLSHRITALPSVSEVRQCGFIAGIELRGDQQAQPSGELVALAARRRGVLIHACGNVLVLIPPPAISETDLCRLVAVTASSIAEVAIGRLPAAA